MRVFNKIVSWLITVILLFSMFVCVYAVYQLYTGEPLPMIFGWGSSRVLTGSMEPTIPVDALVIVQEKESYAPGDIVMYLNSNNNLITHRLVSLNDDIAITKGDANNTNDPPINTSQIVGSIQYIIPGAGKTLAMIRTPEVLTFLAITLLIVWTAPIIIPRKEGMKNNEEECI